MPTVESYEAKLDRIDALYGKGLPERDDAQLEQIARLVYGCHQVVSDASWKEQWLWVTDAYANAMSGGSSLLSAAKEIRRIVLEDHK